MKEKIIIVGNGAAGNAALEEIMNHSKDCEITVVTTEAVPVYYRPMLSEYISEIDVPKRFYLHDQAWYDANNVHVVYQCEIIALDTLNQTIAKTNGELIPYDKLILCTGSKNFIPPMPGSKKDNVIDLRTLSDADLIKYKAKNTSKATIIGGGLLGLELGWQLRKLNIDVTVIEMMARLLPRQLDEEASLLFEEKVAATGIKILKGVQTQEIIGEDAATGVLLANGEVIDADLVVFSIGIRADTLLAKNGNINIDRGIIVDDFMRTSAKNVFAAGDCAEYNGLNYAIWPEAIEQGKVAGLNAIGIETVYEPVIPFNIYHGMDIRLFSMGDVGGNPANEYSVHRFGEVDNFEKYFYVNDILVGGILMGNISKSSKLKKAIVAGMSKSEFESL